MKGSTLALLGLGAVGVAVGAYFLFFRKKVVPGRVMTSPDATQLPYGQGTLTPPGAGKGTFIPEMSANTGKGLPALWGSSGTIPGPGGGVATNGGATKVWLPKPNAARPGSPRSGNTPANVWNQLYRDSLQQSSSPEGAKGGGRPGGGLFIPPVTGVPPRKAGNIWQLIMAPVGTNAVGAALNATKTTILKPLGGQVTTVGDGYKPPVVY